MNKILPLNSNKANVFFILDSIYLTVNPVALTHTTLQSAWFWLCSESQDNSSLNGEHFDRCTERCQELGLQWRQLGIPSVCGTYAVTHFYPLPIWALLPPVTVTGVHHVHVPIEALSWALNCWFCRLSDGRPRCNSATRDLSRRRDERPEAYWHIWSCACTLTVIGFPVMKT